MYSKSFIRAMGKKRMARIEAAVKCICDHEVSKGNATDVRTFTAWDVVKLDIFVNGHIGSDPPEGYSFRRYRKYWVGPENLARIVPMPTACDQLLITVECVAGLIGAMPYEQFAQACGIKSGKSLCNF